MNQQQQIAQAHDMAKHMVDAASVGVAAATLLDLLPALAALFTIIWTGIRIYETKTIQKLLGKSKE